MAEMRCARCKKAQPMEAFPMGDGGRRKRLCLTCRSASAEAKACKTCGKTKPLAEFHRQVNAPDGYSYTCKTCAGAYQKQHYEVHTAAYKETRDRWYTENRERIRAQTAAKHRERKIRVLQAYGGRCACCGEANLGLLTLDHVQGDGAAHRRELRHGKTSIRIYHWAEENGYPDKLQVLCWNCNSGSWHNKGTCPHKDPQWAL